MVFIEIGRSWFLFQDDCISIEQFLCWHHYDIRLLMGIKSMLNWRHLEVLLDGYYLLDLPFNLDLDCVAPILLRLYILRREVRRLRRGQFRFIFLLASRRDLHPH